MASKLEILRNKRIEQTLNVAKKYGLEDFCNKFDSLNSVYESDGTFQIDLKSCPKVLKDMLEYLNFERFENGERISFRPKVFSSPNIGYVRNDSHHKFKGLVQNRHMGDFSDVLRDLLNDWVNNENFDYTGRKYVRAIKEELDKANLFKDYYFKCDAELVNLVRERFQELDLERLENKDVHSFINNMKDDEKISILILIPDIPLDKNFKDKKEPEQQIGFQIFTKKELMDKFKNSIVLNKYLSNSVVLRNGQFVNVKEDMISQFKFERKRLGKDLFTCSIIDFLGEDKALILNDFIRQNNPFIDKEKISSKKISKIKR